MQVVVYTNEYLKIIWDEVHHTQITQWPGGYVGKQIREGLDMGLTEFIKLQKKHPDAAWIGDTRDLDVINTVNQKWIDADWFPRFLRTGVRLMAVIAPKSMISTMSVKAIVSRVPETALTVRYCQTIKESNDWILTERQTTR